MAGPPVTLLKFSCVALLFVLASCKRELPPAESVLHLDLTLADGSSSTARLAASEVTWVEKLEPAGDQADLGSWSPQYCRVHATPNGGGGVALVGIVVDGPRMKRVELTSSKNYAASEIDFVELELARTTSGIARVSWRSSLDGAEASEYPRAATMLVPNTNDPIKLRIPLASQPGWVGTISDLSIAPKEDGTQRFDLIGLRLGRIGFTPGPDALGPLGASASGDKTAGDGGLIALGREARRAWPSDWNVPLFAKARIPRGGKLCIEAGVSTNTTNVTAEVRFRVDARTDDGAEWKPVGSTSIVPGMRAQGPAWEHLTVPLAEFAGREIQLRFLADDQGEPKEGGSLDRARLYWGEPLIEGEYAKDGRPNVILITLDTVRADAIGAFKRGGGTSPTPFLDSLAARGIVFEQAWSACNSTSPSHASLMTGLAVQDHGLIDNRSLLDASNVTLAENFRAAGWQTAAAVSVLHLTPEKSGLGQGFDRFWLGDNDSAADGALTGSAVKEWLRAFGREGARPTFLWLHLFDAHTPYDVPKGFLEQYARRMGTKIPPRKVTPASLPANRFSPGGQFLADVTNKEWAEFMYRACVAYDDEQLKQVFAVLEQHGGLDNTFIAVIADHGEALGEHDNYYHHTGLFREVMHVPLIVIAPGGPRGVRVTEPVWSLDLSRTLFKLAGLPIPEGVRGTDLLEFTALSSRPKRRIFFEHSDLHQVGCTDEQHSAIYTVVDYLQLGPERKIAADTLQLYDAVADPGQLHDLGSEDAAANAKYRELISDWRSKALKRTTLKGHLSPEEEHRLKQLGY